MSGLQTSRRSEEKDHGWKTAPPPVVNTRHRRLTPLERVLLGKGQYRSMKPVGTGGQR